MAEEHLGALQHWRSNTITLEESYIVGEGQDF